MCRSIHRATEPFLHFFARVWRRDLQQFAATERAKDEIINGRNYNFDCIDNQNLWHSIHSLSRFFAINNRNHRLQIFNNFYERLGHLSKIIVETSLLRICSSCFLIVTPARICSSSSGWRRRFKTLPAKGDDVSEKYFENVVNLSFLFNSFVERDGHVM